MDKINSLGDINIIWINGDLKLNGSSIPNVNIFEDGKDLIVLKSNNLSEIFSTLRQYFYEKVILPDTSKTAALGRALSNYVNVAIAKDPNNNDLKELKGKIRPNELVKLVLYDQTLGKVLDSQYNINGETARTEVKRLLDSLTEGMSSKKVKAASRYNPNPTSPNIEEHFIMVPDAAKIFRNRTIENAGWSDITISLAENFDSPGEKLTADAAQEKLVKSSLDNSVEQIVEELWQQITEKGLPQDDVKLNIAGNGINHLRNNQEHYDDLVLAVIQGLQSKGLKIKEIRSGGQSGIDEAGTKAGIKLGLPWSVLAPDGYQVVLKGRRTEGKEQFIKRFDPTYTSSGIAQINGVTKNEDGTISIVNHVTNETYIVSGESKWKLSDDLYVNVTQRYFPDPKLSKAKEVAMYFPYDRQQRSEVHSKTTFEAVIQGERKSTTRYSGDGHLDFWLSFKKGTLLKCRSTRDKNDSKVEYVYVEITEDPTEITPDMINDPAFLERWSKAEGWSQEYLKKSAQEHFAKGERIYWIQYKLVDPRYTQNQGAAKRQQIRKESYVCADYILGNKRLQNADMVQQNVNNFLNPC